MGPAPVDYLEALRLKRATAEFTLGGRSFTVPRARLGLHYELRSLRDGQQPSPADLGGLAVRYVALATGLTEDDVDEAEPSELLTAFGRLTNLNGFRGTLPVLWQQEPTGRPGARAVENYPNRALASIVTTLSHAYSWGVDHILELGPEEAACYMQEAIVLDHQQRELEWARSGGAVGEKGERRRFPEIRWGRPPDGLRPPPEADDGRPKRGMPAKFIPGGIIIRGKNPPRR